MIGNKPLVSIIMGVYNCKNKHLLEESVKSIVNQTYNNWELIICNDGSSDNTYKVLKEIQKLDKRINVVSYNENKGLPYALNECLKSSRGIYIARQDDDDISYPNRLDKEVLFLENNKEYALVGSIAEVYDDDGVYGEYNLEEKPTNESFLWNSPFLHPSIVIRKEVLKKCDGYRIAKETRRCEDYDLFMRMYSLGYKGYNIQEKLYKYRIDRNETKKHRPMKYRIDEYIVRKINFKKLGINFPKRLIYSIKPILVGLLPNSLVKKINKHKYKLYD